MKKTKPKYRDIIQAVVDARDFHLVSRTTRQIADYLGLPEDEVEDALKAAPAMRRSTWTNLWGFSNGQDAGVYVPLTHTREPVRSVKKPAPEPRYAQKVPEPSIEGLLDDL